MNGAEQRSAEIKVGKRDSPRKQGQRLGHNQDGVRVKGRGLLQGMAEMRHPEGQKRGETKRRKARHCRGVRARSELRPGAELAGRRVWNRRQGLNGNRRQALRREGSQQAQRI